MKLKTTSKQHDGKTLTFEAVKNDVRASKDNLVLIKVMEGDYCIASYYLGTLIEHGDTNGWCVCSSRYEPYRAVSNKDADKLIIEAAKLFPDDWENYKAEFMATVK